MKTGQKRSTGSSGKATKQSWYHLGRLLGDSTKKLQYPRPKGHYDLKCNFCGLQPALSDNSLNQTRLSDTPEYPTHPEAFKCAPPLDLLRKCGAAPLRGSLISPCRDPDSIPFPYFLALSSFPQRLCKCCHLPGCGCLRGNWRRMKASQSRRPLPGAWLTEGVA